MNREQATKYRDRHLQYQYDLCHYLPSSISGLYVKKLYNSSKRNRVSLPNEITDSNVKFCGNCGIVRTINKTVQITKTATDGMRVLQYRCLNCGVDHKFELGPEPVFKRIGKVETPEKRTQKPTNSAKPRSKKRKMNSLSNLLSKKNEERSKSNTSLSLDSFMQK